MTGTRQKSLHGNRAFVTPEDYLVGRGAHAAGGVDKPMIVLPGSPDYVAEFEDFLGLSDTGVSTRYNDKWIVGFSDTGQILPQQGPIGVSSQFTNGVFRMTSSATSTQTPDGGCQSLNTPAEWKANQGRLRFGARLKIATLAGNSVFVGFTDSGGTEMPAYDTGGGIITPAADYVGFICSGEGGATQQAWRLVSGKAGTDQSATTGVTPTANTYDTLEVELPGNDGGLVIGYINGKPVASINSAAVTPTVAMAAGVWRANTEGAANAVDIDWLNVSALRDTGT